MSDATGLIGRPVRRVEDARYTTGTGRYLDDLNLPGMLHLRLVRSTIAHGVIDSIRLGDWAPPPEGTLLVTGADCPDLSIAADVPVESWQHSAQPALAVDRVRFVGEPVAAVLHPDPYVAEDAAELVEVDIRELPPVLDLESALRGEHDPIHPSWSNHLFVKRRRVSGDLDAARAGAHRVIRRVFRNHRQAGVPLENRGCVAVPDPTGQGVTLWSSTQMPHLVRTLVAEKLELPESAVRVVAPDVGGGFGVKGHVFADEVLVCWLALRHRRPVKWVEDRCEHLLASIHARDHLHCVEAYVDERGRLDGIRLQVVVDAGAYSVYPWTAGSDSGMVGKVFPGPYDLRNYEVEDLAVATNKCPLGTYRGVGRPAAVFTMERLMDEIAAELGLDPVEVRRRNVITEFPYTTATGLTYDPGSYRETLELVAKELSEVPGSDGDIAIGTGFALYNEQSAHGALDFALRQTPIESGYQSTTVRVGTDGGVQVFTGLQSHGQGLETTLAQVVATELDVPLEQVKVVHGDTATSPYAMGTWGSRGATLGGASAASAAREVRRKALEIAGHLLECRTEDLEMRDGMARVKGHPTAGVSLATVAYTAIRTIHDLPEGMDPGLESTIYLDGPPRGTFSNSCHGAVVEVHRRTGQVRVRRYVVAEDCGTMINPMVVDGQVHGGVAQGIGSALLEEMPYSADGQPLASTFVDYLMPTCTDVPDIEVHHLCTPSPWTERGMKGMGEAGAIGPMAAIANAVADALRVPVWETPLRPARVAALLRGATPEGLWERWTGTAELAGFWI
ncbi:xanthine dehydrogenase family protein molybdopterin-binding subunit [Pseudonocardia acaciae]|uniref:xanthine dehydrogenase family protein molybdopterin-binding subunit n=1 Tax=Pseudonocardia acaciae TaxID=551276 RepID=UPI0007E8D8AD|nr:xanthine dehydrogenase family protein molybdopterin-binding subunit [Pseudonocardia acaciae]